jgi:hypothetical protein
MDTNELVRSLAADHGWRTRPVATVLAIAIVLALPFTAMMFMMRLGARADIMAATGRPFFLLKFAVTLALVVATVMLALRLVRPGARVGKVAWLLVIPALLLVAGIAVDVTMPQTSSWTSRLVGTNSLVCLAAIPALSLPLLIAALIALRHGAAMRPMLTGAVAGLLAGGIAATFYAAHCLDDSPLFVVTWYGLALTGVAIAGAIAGRWMLRI